MNTPNTANKSDRESISAEIFDPFPEPRTYPKGWDLSGFDSTPNLPAVESAGDEAES
jgi:hypothetical protein